MTANNVPQPTIITLTLPTPEDGGIAKERATATLLIRRGELAHLRQFHYNGYLPDLLKAIHEAESALGQVEDNPPVVPEPAPPPAKSAPKPAPKPPPVPAEPTLEIPLKKGTKAIPISHLKLTGGETDAAAYRQAVLIAGRLIDGKLWDGNSPIRIDDVYAVAKKLKHLADKELSLFALTDFVQIGTVEQDTSSKELADDSDQAFAPHADEAAPTLL